jgi:hypothetical protein
MIEVLRRGVRKEAQAVEELLQSTELFEKDAHIVNANYSLI